LGQRHGCGATAREEKPIQINILTAWPLALVSIDATSG
jgi:hypothetical protein